MQFFYNLPVRRKLIAIIMLVSSVALLVASAAFVTYEQTATRARMAQTLSVTAAMTGANCTAGLSFDEVGSVEQTLKSLSAQPDIVQACVYDKQGRLFARYAPKEPEHAPPLRLDGKFHATAARFVADRLELFQPISLAGETIGTIYLEEDLGETTARLWRYLAIGGLVLLGAAGVAFLLSAWLQRVISQPLSDLAKTVTLISTEKNYAVRAAKLGSDELGSLIDGFNEMLAQIQERDATLEQRVTARTRELAESLSVLHATLESTADGMLVIDSHEQVVSYNRKFIEMWGIPAEKLAAAPAGGLVALAAGRIEDDTTFLTRMRDLYRQPDAESFDVIQLKDGRLFERYSIPQRLDGQTVGRVWSFRDVTERKRIEREIVESRNFLDRIINSISDPVFVKDRQHRWVLINDAGCSFVGAAREAILGKTVHDIFPKAEAEIFWAKDELVFSTGRENVNEEKFTDAAGVQRTIITKKNLYVDEKGGMFIVGVIQDISERQRAADALRESEANYSSLVDQMPAGIFRKDKEGRYVFVNSRFCRFRGAAPTDYVGKLPREITDRLPDAAVAKELRIAAEQHHAEILRTGRQIELEEKYQLPDGRMVYHHVIKSPVFGADGSVVGSQGILMDITQRKLAEAELRQERELLRALLDNSEEVVYFKDRDSRFIRGSAAMARMFGEDSPEALLGKRDADFFTSEHAQRAFADEQEIVRTGRSIVGKLEKETWPDGHITWALTTKMPLRNSSGEIVGTFGISKDITALKAAQQRVAHEQERFKFIFDSVPVGISLARHSADGTLLERLVNDAHLRICGLTPDQNKDLSVYRQITHPDDYRLQAKFGRRIEKGEINQFTIEKRYVRFDGKTVWVIYSFQRRRFADGSYEDLCTVSDITELKQAQERAAREQARFKIIFDSVPVGISLARVGADGQLLERHINDAHLRICGLTREENEDLAVYGRITHPDDRNRQAAFAPLIESGKLSQFTIEKRYLRFDGKTVWVNFSFQRRRFPDGSYEDLCTVSDITANKAAEEERDKLNHQLVEASRRAGMAEVATSVLHNVGNVLNSINVSTTLVLDTVKKSRLNSLDRLAALIYGERERLAEFFTNDFRGKQLPDYFMKLVAHLGEEQNALVGEIELTRKNIEHIKDIVTMQQNYAKVSGVVEKVKVTDLVEDALRMNAGALSRHNVQVRREYPDEPVEIYVERQKVLQILVNLIRNAKYACDESGREDKWLSLRVRVNDGYVEIVTQDNGVGIPPENLTRIFNHGFTTRENGHGFGLHSGALAARELGGSLTARSDGPGQGAAFTLVLPLELVSQSGPQPTIKS